MNWRSSVLLISPVLLLAACNEATEPTAGGGATPGTTSRPSAAPAALTAEDVHAVWPADGSTVLSTFDLVVGLPEMPVDGRLAVLIDGNAVPAGTAVTAGENVLLLPEGANSGEIVLPAGDQQLCIQALDSAGASRGPEWSTSVSYTVVEDPEGGRRVRFASPADGATVGRTFKVVFEVEGMGLWPATEKILDHTVGHHHVLIGRGPMPPSMVIPNDPTHVHYGQAQTEGELTLEPGTYQLTMQFADGAHRSYGPRMAASIEVTVE